MKAPTPCELLECEHIKLCETGQACPLFKHFVEKGTIVLHRGIKAEPSVEVYNEIFPEC